jgi:hypothetical protein
MVSAREKQRRAEQGGRAGPPRRVLPNLLQPGSGLRDEPEPEMSSEPVASAPSAPSASLGMRRDLSAEGASPAIAAILSRGSVNFSHLGEEETIALIDFFIDHPPEGSVVMRISKRVADHVIGQYNENRPIKPASIRDYSESVGSEQWDLTGESVKFTDARKFRDGQNRFLAVSRTNGVIITDVRFGIADRAFSKMDRGKARSVEDNLALAGYKDARTLSGAVRWVALYDEDRIKSRQTFKPDRVLSLLQDKYGDLKDQIPQARQIYDTTGQPKGMVAALLYLTKRANPEKGKAFAEAFEFGSGSGEFKAIKLATQRLEQIRVQTSGRVHELVRFAILIRAWNAYIGGKRPTKSMLNWTLEEPFPKVDS